MRTALLGSTILSLWGLLACLLWSWEPTRTLAGAGAGQGLAVSADPVQRPTALAPVPTGGDFTLDFWERRVDARDLRGSVVLIYFGYT